MNWDRFNPWKTARALNYMHDRKNEVIRHLMGVIEQQSRVIDRLNSKVSDLQNEIAGLTAAPAIEVDASTEIEGDSDE